MLPLIYLYDIPLYSTAIENNNKYKFEAICEIDDMPQLFKDTTNEDEECDIAETNFNIYERLLYK